MNPVATINVKDEPTIFILKQLHGNLIYKPVAIDQVSERIIFRMEESFEGSIINTSMSNKSNETGLSKFTGKFSSKLGSFFTSLRTKTKPYAGVFGSLALIVFLGAGVFLVQNIQNLSSEASGAVLTLSTNNANPAPGTNFVVAAAIDTTGLKVCGADLEVKYDPTKVDLVSWNTGNFLPVVLAPPTNSNGTLTLTVGCDPTNPKTGTGILAQAEFKAKTDGNTSITWGPGTQIAAYGQTTDASGTKNSATITIMTVTPTPGTPSPTVAPATPPPGTIAPTAIPLTPTPEAGCSRNDRRRGDC